MQSINSPEKIVSKIICVSYVVNEKRKMCKSRNALGGCTVPVLRFHVDQQAFNKGYHYHRPLCRVRGWWGCCRYPPPSPNLNTPTHTGTSQKVQIFDKKVLFLTRRSTFSLKSPLCAMIFFELGRINTKINQNCLYNRCTFLSLKVHAGCAKSIIWTLWLNPGNLVA